MVYYGAVSKGCHRCRRRKVKCDQRKPQCLRCERAKVTCPGFRDLSTVIFRDESERIIRKARGPPEERQMGRIMSPTPFSQTSSAFPRSCRPMSPSQALSWPVQDRAAHFFFANYTCVEPPMSESYHAWLTQLYCCEDRTNHAVQAAVQAAGMAALANVFYAPDVAAKSTQAYCRALDATKQALSDPIESTSDTTLLTVLLLGLYEYITFEGWNHIRSWATHIEGATALLQLRGQKQFTYERGAELFMQLRGQIIYACMQQYIPAPEALLQITEKFQTSPMGERRKSILPGPLGNTCFRFLDLRSAIRNGSLCDAAAIRFAAIEIDNELEAWRATLPSTWRYTTVDAAEDVPTNTYFDGKRHIYTGLWIARIWNNWRAIRIVVNKIIYEHQIPSTTPDTHPLCLIRQLSTDICISTPSFMGSPRSSALIWPLLVVLQEELNPRDMRCWAAEQLRRIGSSVGIRQPALLADSIERRLTTDLSGVGDMEA